MTQKIIIIGAGPAGIEAARAAAKAGARVTLVSEGPVGGRCGWHSLLPSKVWLSAADTAGELAESPFTRTFDAPVPAAILPRLQSIKERWNLQQVEMLKPLGVEIINGVASFETARQVVVQDQAGQIVARRSGDAVILAPGSVPFFPPNLKPDGKQIIAPRFMSGLKELPPSIAIIGAGATGTEVVYLFNRLGVKVTWIVDKFGVLPAFDPPVGEFMAAILVKRGVNLVPVDLADHFETEGEGVVVVMPNGSRQKAAMAFVAIGRFPDLKRLNLEAAGLSPGDGKFLDSDEYCRTEVPGIYVVGDASGPPMVANRAMAQAWVAGSHAAGAKTAPFNPQTVITAIYTEPQAAQVGAVALTNNDLQTVRIPFDTVMKTHFLTHLEGFVELTYTPDRRLAGAVAVGPHAADVLAPVALAIQLGASLDDMAMVFAAHPTLSELAFAAARQA